MPCLAVFLVLVLGLCACPPPGGVHGDEPILGGWINTERNIGLLFLKEGVCLAYTAMDPGIVYESRDDVPKDMPLDKDIWVPHTKVSWSRNGQRISMERIQTVWAMKGDPHSAFTVIECGSEKLAIKWDHEPEVMHFVGSDELKHPEEFTRKRKE